MSPELGSRMTPVDVICLLLIVSSWVVAPALDAAEPMPRRGKAEKYQILQTDNQVRFGLLGAKPRKPAPTLIVLASTAEETLGSDYFLQCGVVLARQGYLCISVDLPCHGQDRKPGEREGLSGWSQRVDAGEDLLGDFERRVKDVLDYLVARKYTDPEKIAVCGTSRGGFAALHLAAGQPRVRCVVAMAPVTNLMLLDEFRGISHPERAEALSVSYLAEKLIDRDVWMVIGDQDQRVGTGSAQAFAAQLSAEAADKRLPCRIDFRVVAEPRGHTTPGGAAEQAAAWLARRFKANKRS